MLPRWVVRASTYGFGVGSTDIQFVTYIYIKWKNLKLLKIFEGKNAKKFSLRGQVGDDTSPIKRKCNTDKLHGNVQT